MIQMPNLDKVPKNTTTHYTFTIYPDTHFAPAPQTGHAPRPQIQRKATKDARPFTPAEKVILGPIVEEPKPRSKFRQNIDKAALAEYFNNDCLPSREEQIEAWHQSVVAELEAKEAIAKAKAEREQEELFYFVAQLKNISEKEAVLELVNNFIADRFVQKYNGADTNAAMRAYEKQKRHSAKIARMMHELGITK